MVSSGIAPAGEGVGVPLCNRYRSEVLVPHLAFVWRNPLHSCYLWIGVLMTLSIH